MTERILVWDIPTRVFHWLFALSFAGAFLTAESERFHDIHVLLGYTFMGLLVFRLVWGLIGTRYARFKSFLFQRAELSRYLLSLLNRSPRHYLGHNPAGAIAIFTLLGLGTVAAATGVATYHEYGGEWMEELHEGVSNLMLAIVFVHIAGVVVSSLLHHENLVWSMIDGHKRGELREGIRYSHISLGVVMIAGVIGFWYAYPRQPDTVPAKPAAATVENTPIPGYGNHRKDD